MDRVLNFAILGDSAAAGIGDSDKSGNNYGWGYYLAQAFENPLVYLNVSRPGAQSLEVLNIQLPKISSINPDLVAVIVGGNDILRNGFSPELFRTNLRKTLEALRLHGAEILLLQIHDPTHILPIPKLLGDVLLRRVNAVNQVISQLATEFEAILLQPHLLDDIYNLKSWHFDRMHPSKFGHRKIAKGFRDLLVKRGWKISDVEVSMDYVASRREGITWMIKKGTPWFFKRSFDLLPAALILCVVEWTRQKYLKIRQHYRSDAQLYFPEFALTKESYLPQVLEEKVS